MISSEPLPAGALFLKFLLPCFGERYVAADVVNQSVRDRKALSGPAQRQYVYGVRFTGIYSHREMLDQLVSSADTIAEASSAGHVRE